MDIIVDTRDELGESILWCTASQRLWWVDVLSAILHELTWPHAVHRTHKLPFRRVGSIGLHAQGGLIVATERGIFRWSATTGVGAQLMQPQWDPATHRLNDGRCDRAGRFWVGSMHDSLFEPEGQLFSIGAGRGPDVHLSEIIVPNSTAFSPDDRSFYFADTRRYVIWVFDFDLPSGMISNRRIFADFNAGKFRPDGSCVDSAGCLWNASYEGAQVVRYSPRGIIDTIIPLPVSFPTCVCLGGPDLDTLFVTSARFALSDEQRAREPLAGGVFAMRVPTLGLPEAGFAASTA